MNILWTNNICDISDEDIEMAKHDLVRDYDYPSEEGITDEEILYYLYPDFELEELRKRKSDKVVGVAELGLWDGKHTARGTFNNIGDIFYTDCDYVTWYFDEEGNLCQEAIHHDGRNHAKYFFENGRPVKEEDVAM